MCDKIADRAALWLVSESASLRLAISVIQTRAAEVRQPCPFKHFKHSAGRSEMRPEFIAVRIFIFIFTVFIFNYHSPSDFSLWPRLNCLLPPMGGKQLKHLAAWVQGARDTCRENTRPALARSLSNYPCDANLAALWESANEWCHVWSDWAMSQAAREREC